MSRFCVGLQTYSSSLAARSIIHLELSRTRGAIGVCQAGNSLGAVSLRLIYSAEMIKTQRLRLLPATLDLSRAEIADTTRFARLLGADVPANWPPESSADALEFFLGLLETHPTWEGWLAWYVLERQSETDEWTLVAGIGFKGEPDVDGRVEMGYSVLPQFQRRGLATEMAQGLVEWAWATGRVREVLAQTTQDNLGSRGVLKRLGFSVSGPGTEPGHTMYTLTQSPGATLNQRTGAGEAETTTFAQ